MKNNTLSLKDKNGNKKEYRILFDIESKEDSKNFVIYTDETKDKKGEIKAYVSTYERSPKGNMTKLKSVTDESEFDFIEKILNSLQK
jgi:uncharacterized protein YrzB (UPF0473 family)